MTAHDTDHAWEKWGESDPYFAVLTGEEYRAGSIADRRAAFFASGEAFVDETLARAARLYPDMRFGRALDFGCGVGRLALPLARRFDEVVGLDISPGMLRQAAANADEAGLANVRFALSDDELSNAGDGLDFANTCIVLQHIPVARGMGYMERMLSLLAPGGIANFHFTIDRQQGFVRDLVYWARVNLPLVQPAVNLLRGRPASEPLMQMNEYSFPAVLQLFERHGIDAPNVIPVPQGTTLALYLLGRKRG